MLNTNSKLYLATKLHCKQNASEIGFNYTLRGKTLYSEFYTY